MARVAVKCNRCGKLIEGIRTSTGSSGFHDMRSWEKYTQTENEKNGFVCDECMHKDPKYRKDYDDFTNPPERGK